MKRRFGFVAHRVAAVVGLAATAGWCGAETLNIPIVIGWSGGTVTNTRSDLNGVVQVACGWSHTYVLKSDGTLVGWYEGSSEPIDTPADLGIVTQIACGAFHTYALKSDGSPVGWGFNDFGETDTPANLGSVTQVDCGYGYTYALTTDGSPVGWGWNNFGQINTPSGLSGVTQIACGEMHTYSLKSDGTLIGWGYGGATDTPRDLNGVVQVACGSYHTYALKNDGTLVGWGPIFRGGEDSNPTGLSGVTQIDCGEYHTYARRSDGTLFGWVVSEGFFSQYDPPDSVGRVAQFACGNNGRTYAIAEGDCDADNFFDSIAVSAGLVPDLNANQVPDSCDVARGWEEDCNTNGIIDGYEQSLNQTASADSGVLPRIGFGHPQQWVYASPSLSLDDPVLTISAMGDFSAPGETLTVTLNGRFVGTFLVEAFDKNDCRSSMTRTISLPRTFYNECVSAPGGATDAIFDFTTSVAVNADQCLSGSWVRAQLSYTAAVVGDCNANSLLDSCEIALDPSLDGNADGVIDACQGMGVVFLCPGDLDGGGSVDTADLSLLLMSFGAAMPGDPADLDDNQHIDTADLSLLLLSFGPCG
jgi:hypothetical protein